MWLPVAYADWLSSGYPYRGKVESQQTYGSSTICGFFWVKRTMT